MNWFQENHLCQSTLIESENRLSEDIKENLKWNDPSDLWGFSSIIKDSPEKILYAHNYVLKDIYQKAKEKSNYSIMALYNH
jgi:hypothetical protein